MLRTQLIEFGLSSNEAELYLAALSTGECSVGTLEKATGLHRQLIYIAADSLSNRGLMQVERRAGKKRFNASSPEVFEEIATTQLEKSQQLSKDLQTLKADFGFSGAARHLEGTEAVRRYYYESTARQHIGSRVDILGVNSSRFFEIFPPDSSDFKRLENKRIERKTTWRVLLSGNLKKELLLNENRKLFSCRVLKEKIAAPIDIIVWGDHVGLLLYGNEPSVMDIPGEISARGFRSYLAALWKRAT